MLKKFVDKNKFGGYTYEIEMTPLCEVSIQGDDKGAYVVDFKEFGFFGNTTRFSFISNQPLKETVVNCFEKTSEYFRNKPHYHWKESEMPLKIHSVLNSLAKYGCV